MPEQWTYADVWETVAKTVPNHAALVHGLSRTSWRDFEKRAGNLGAALVDAGLAHQDKVAVYLHNCPEYLEAVFGAVKAALVPVNTNYRYVDDELLYLWRNADAAAVVFHGVFTDRVAALRTRCPHVLVWIHVDDGSIACPDWALPYESLANALREAKNDEARRSGDDLILIYTGGTTGLPRGVMWRQDDLYLASNTTGDPKTPDLDVVRTRIASTPGPVGLSAAPLMHGTGFVFATTILNRGGTLVTAEGRQFDPVSLLDTIVRERVTDLCIVGDAFCRPIVEQLELQPGYWDLSSLRVISSSGMMWSKDVKNRLLAHAPTVLMIDFLNSSEASGIGRSLTSSRKSSRSAGFQLGDNAFVIRDDGSPVQPGSGDIGRVAVRGFIPMGYYKDPEKTALTFPVVDGIRCAVPGDYATVENDGSITLLGRGSVSINTGGEKVFPEEVEEAIKTFPTVRDAVVVGVPDARFGEIVTAAVEISDNGTIQSSDLIEHVRQTLARHKAPRHIMVVRSMGRGPNGKADYPGLRKQMIEWLRSDQRDQSGAATP